MYPEAPQEGKVVSLADRRGQRTHSNNREVGEGAVVPFVKKDPLLELDQLAQTGSLQAFFSRVVALSKTLGVSPEEIQNRSYLSPDTIVTLANGTKSLSPHRAQYLRDYPMREIVELLTEKRILATAAGINNTLS